MNIASIEQLKIWKDDPTVQIAFFGSGYICDKTTQISGIVPDLIVDNNQDAQGKLQNKILISSPLDDTSDHIIYVITSTSINEISEQLISLKVSHKNIFVSPVLRDHLKISSFESQSFDFIFTSGLQNRSQSLELNGGGIYRVRGDFTKHTLEKVLPGASHGIKQIGDSLFIVNEEHGIVELDKNLSIINNHELPKGLRAHGIDFCDERNEWIIACSYGDGILILDHKFNQIDFVRISDNLDCYGGKAQHHVNDVCVVGSYAYCSMFSITGNFKRGIYDGGVSIINLASKKVTGHLYGNLKNPHSISFFDGEFWILDSFRKSILRGDSVIAEGFSTFLRGLDFAGNETLLLGQSKNRNLSINNNEKLKPIFLDTSILIYNIKENIAKTISIPSAISEIHAIKDIRK